MTFVLLVILLSNQLARVLSQAAANEFPQGVVLALIGLIFTFHSWAVAGGPFIMAVLIMMLELFVALLQAYIFTLLSSVFIGLIREGAH